MVDNDIIKELDRAKLRYLKSIEGHSYYNFIKTILDNFILFFSEAEWLTHLIEKINNIERQQGWVERNFKLGGRIWRIGNALYVGREDSMGYLAASEDECKEFKRLFISAEVNKQMKNKERDQDNLNDIMERNHVPRSIRPIKTEYVSVCGHGDFTLPQMKKAKDLEDKTLVCPVCGGCQWYIRYINKLKPEIIKFEPNENIRKRYEEAR